MTRKEFYQLVNKERKLKQLKDAENGAPNNHFNRTFASTKMLTDTFTSNFHTSRNRKLLNASSSKEMNLESRQTLEHWTLA